MAKDDPLTCWWCGVEPEEVHELRSLDGKIRDLPHWPPGDHTHAVKPPSPDGMFDTVMLQPLREI